MRILVSGSHGLIGNALVERLTQLEHSVVRLVRGKPQANEILWNPATAAVDTEQLEGFDAVVHLGGANLGDKRWTIREKSRIWDSRVVPTEFLARRFVEVVDRPAVMVFASGIGYYGNRGDEVLSEVSAKGEGFLSDLVEQWEDAATPAREAGIRTVHLRSGVVLDTGGGALQKQLPLFRLGIGGKLGPGTQWFSWISLHDEVEAIIFALTNAAVVGPINCCSPQPVTNAEFTIALGAAVNRPVFIPVWRWMLDIAFGKEMTDEMLLVSQRATPAKLTELGFAFRDDELETAFKNIFQAEKDRRAAKKAADEAEIEALGKKKRGRMSRNS